MLELWFKVGGTCVLAAVIGWIFSEDTPERPCPVPGLLEFFRWLLALSLVGIIASAFGVIWSW